MKSNKSKWTFIITILIITLFPTIACADIGPKAQLVIRVQNPPDELYYLDLLTQETKTYDNFSNDEREALNENMVELLYSYEENGWKPAFVEGTGVPMWGDLTGKQNSNGRVHTFGYVGLPETYRIIIVTASGAVSVSDTITRKSLQSNVTYNYITNEVIVPNIMMTYLLQFISTCIPTLIIEGLILIIFGFSLKNNLKVFLLINIVTQILLTLTVGATLIKAGTVSAYIIQLPVELGILITETIIYGKLLKGQAYKRRIAYGIIANLVSWGIGMLFLNYQYKYLLKFM